MLTQRRVVPKLLETKIQAVSNGIHQKTLRGGTNFIVVSPETATIIESLSLDTLAAILDGDAMNNKYAMIDKKLEVL